MPKSGNGKGLAKFYEVKKKKKVKSLGHRVL